MITADREILFERKTVIIGLNAELGMWGTLSLAFRSMWGNWRKKRTQKKREKKICWILSLTFPTTTPLCSIPCKVYAWSIIMLAITIEWSNLSHLFLPSFFHFSGSQEGKSETLLKMCVRTGDNFTFSLFFTTRYDSCAQYLLSMKLSLIFLLVILEIFLSAVTSLRVLFILHSKLYRNGAETFDARRVDEKWTNECVCTHF